MKVKITVFMAAWGLMAGAGLAQAGEMAPVKAAGTAASKGAVQSVIPLTEEQMGTVSAGSNGPGIGALPGLPAAVPSFVPPLPRDDSLSIQTGRWS
jgi:hypothetical protein